MKNSKIMFYYTLMIALISFFSCSNNSSEIEDINKSKLESLSGTYMDVKPYSYGDAFGQRVFTFNEGNWTLKFTLGLDPNLETQVFEFRTFGKYKVVNKSNIVEGAYNAEFGEEKKFVTLKTDDPQLIEAFGFTSCGLNPDIEKDISADGCSLWKPVSECPIDYDLLYLNENGELHFGQRPTDNNMCTADKRPTALTPGTTKI